jgi:hypothetical protein
MMLPRSPAVGSHLVVEGIFGGHLFPADPLDAVARKAFRVKHQGRPQMSRLAARRTLPLARSN